jgi:threonine synthase
MLSIYKNSSYIADPHGAVGYLGLKHYVDNNPGKQGIFFETAHPVKFLDVIEPVIDKKIEFPDQIKQIMDKKKESTPIDNYDQLKVFLLK